MAPELSGTTVDGKTPVADAASAATSLLGEHPADYRGKVVVINAWGSWCPTCRAETKDFVAV
ncbi:peroxiredoxin family protein [Streptomyces misionensis]|uniref:peroxiredoxin family protein n=1 Tax=Streptomyces misionensis TaxID=67331 RepID=UPI000941CD12